MVALSFAPNLFDKSAESCIIKHKWKPTVQVEFFPPL